jgi:hypothetical protein
MLNTILHSLSSARDSIAVVDLTVNAESQFNCNIYMVSTSTYHTDSMINGVICMIQHKSFQDRVRLLRKGEANSLTKTGAGTLQAPGKTAVESFLQLGSQMQAHGKGVQGEMRGLPGPQQSL